MRVAYDVQDEKPPMLRIERQNKSFTRLAPTTCVEASIMERYDLQEFIFNSPDDFFKEIGEHLFVIDKEVQPSQEVQDRVDILALDADGNAVIVELKRGNNRCNCSKQSHTPE
jgi:RecB family endonuclease NucS